MIRPVEKEIVIKNKRGIKMDADAWLSKNFEYVIDNFAGGYVVIVDDQGIVYTDADGRPGELTRKARRKYPKSKILFFRVPHPQDFLCALILL